MLPFSLSLPRFDFLHPYIDLSRRPSKLSYSPMPKNQECGLPRIWSSPSRVCQSLAISHRFHPCEWQERAKSSGTSLHQAVSDPGSGDSSLNWSTNSIYAPSLARVDGHVGHCLVLEEGTG